MCRLRIGHTLPTHRYLMERGNPPVCSHCGQLLTVKHVLVECQRTEQWSTILCDTNFKAEKLVSYLRAMCQMVSSDAFWAV